MLTSFAFPLLVVAFPIVQDAGEIMNTAQIKQNERRETVDNYTVIQTIAGLEVPTYYEKVLVDGQPLFRVVPRTEWERKRSEDAGMHVMTSDEMNQTADVYEMMGDATGAEMDRQGMPRIPGMDFQQMMYDGATMYRGAAAYEENDGRGDAADAAEGMAQFARRAQLIGREKVGDREAFLLRADDLSDVPLEQPSDGGTFTLKTASMWIDAREYVPLRLLMEGQMEKDGQTTPITIEKLDQDYRRVGPMYESHRQVMRLTGLMGAISDEDRRDLEKARADMEKLEAQMEQMPAMARRMMEGQLEKARAQMDAMSQDGAVETIVEVSRIDINQGPPKN